MHKIMEAVMDNSTGKEMRKNAQNCGELAEEATEAPARKRYRRMEAAWKSLADTQDWLDGKAKPERVRTNEN
jgi:hypothetical protein